MTDKNDAKPLDQDPQDIVDTSDFEYENEGGDIEEAAAKRKADADKPAEDGPPEIEEDPRDTLEDEIAARRNADAAPAEDEAPAPVEETPQTEENPDDPLVTLKVNGKEERIPRSQLLADWEKHEQQIIADTQKHRSADDRLREATELLREAQKLRSTTQDASIEQNPDRQAKADPNDGSTRQDDDESRFASIVERIQLGDAKEGAAALKELLTEVARQASPADLAEQVRIIEERRETESAVKNFTAENAEIETSPRFRQLFQAEVNETLRADLINAARQRNAAEDDIRYLEQAPVNEIVDAHRHARARGIASGTADILARAKASLEKDGYWINQKPASATSAERQARKETAQQQPATRTRPQQPAASQAAKRPQTASDIIAEEMKARGQAY